MAKSKKGISPLIATVLIIGFTVALAAVIMTWGTRFTRDVQKSTAESAAANVDCSKDVILEIIGVCRDASTSEYLIMVSNEGVAEISDLYVKMYRSDTDVESDTSIRDPVVPKFESKRIITKAMTTGAVKRIEMIPSIMVKGNKVTCSANIIEFGDTSGNAFGDC